MYFAFFRLLAYSGARKGEALALTWADINFREKTINLNKSLYFENNETYLVTTKTRKSKRVISIDDATLSILNRWRKAQIQEYMSISQHLLSDEKQPVFTKYNHMKRKITRIRLAYFNNVAERIYRKHPTLKKITIHQFRHTHASLLFESGAHPKDVQDRLGHEDIQTTFNIYTHVSKKKKDEVAKNFAKYMSN